MKNFLKSSRRFALWTVPFLLLLTAVKIAITLPPSDRPGYWIDVDKLLANVASFPNREHRNLNLDLDSGQLEYSSGRDANLVDKPTKAVEPNGWQIFGSESTAQPGIIDWELIVTRPDGSERRTKLPFPEEPTVLDENTFIGVSATQTLPTGSQKSPSLFSASLYSISANGEPVLLWTKPLYHAQAFRVIGESIFLICPTPMSIDQYQFRSGQLVESTRIPEEIVALLQNSLSARISIEDLPVPVLRVEASDSVKKTQFWTIPKFEPVLLPKDRNVLFKLNNGSDRVGYARFEGDVVEEMKEMGVFDLKGQKVVWTHMLPSDVTTFHQSKTEDRWCFRTLRNGNSEFTVIDSRDGTQIAHWAPFRWICWSLPVIILGFIGCCFAYLRSSWLVRLSAVASPIATSSQKRWIVFLLLSIVFLVPLLTHLWYWSVLDRPIPVHHYVEGYFVGALLASAAWITWGRGRLVVRLIPLFAVVVALLALSRFMLANIALVQEAVGSTLLASSFGFLMFFVLRLLGVHGPRPTLPGNKSSAWTIPIRDLFLFSTSIAVLLAVSVPLIRTLEMPAGFPPGFQQMIVGTIAMYTILGWLVFCELTHRTELAVMSVILLASFIVIEATYELAFGHALVAPRNSFEMAIFRVAASALLTFYFAMQAIFTKDVS